jgi:hypothetical protein
MKSKIIFKKIATPQSKKLKLNGHIWVRARIITGSREHGVELSGSIKWLIYSVGLVNNKEAKTSN